MDEEIGIMVSNKVLILATLLVLVVAIHYSEGGLFRKVSKPFKKVVKGVGKVGKEIGKGVGKVGKEIGRGVKKVGKEVGRGLENSKKLLKKVVKIPLKGLGKVKFPILKLLGVRKKVPVEVEVEQPAVEAPDNEAFDVKLLRLHNELRAEAKAEPALVSYRIFQTKKRLP